MKLNQTLLIATLVAGSFWAGNLTVSAQETTNTPPPQAAQRPPSRTGLERLDLTADQKAKAEPIVLEMRQQVQALRTNSVAATDKRAKYKEIVEATSAKLKDILTPEQLALWQRQNGGPRARPMTAPTAPPMAPPAAPAGEVKPVAPPK